MRSLAVLLLSLTPALALAADLRIEAADVERVAISLVPGDGGTAEVAVTLSSAGQARLEQVTKRSVGQQMDIVVAGVSLGSPTVREAVTTEVLRIPTSAGRAAELLTAVALQAR